MFPRRKIIGRWSVKILAILVTFASVFVAGCQSIPAEESGEIIVSRPLIHARESLIKDRKTQIRWLNTQLEISPFHGIQGSRFTRDIRAFQAGANIQADPTVIGKYKAQQQLDTDNIERRSELSESQHQSDLVLSDALRELELNKIERLEQLTSTAVDENIRRAELVDQIDKAALTRSEAVCAREPKKDDEKDKLEKEKECLDAQKAYIDTLTALIGKSPDITATAAALQPGTIKNVTRKSLDEANADAKDVELDLPAPDANKNIGKSAAAINAIASEIDTLRKSLKVDQDTLQSNDSNVTAINKFEDDLAYRQRVRDEISKTQLDDRHDTFGNTLYKLQYNISVLPKKENPHWAKVEIVVKPDSTYFIPAEYYDEFYAAARSVDAEEKKSLCHYFDNDGCEEIYLDPVTEKIVDSVKLGVLYLQKEAFFPRKLKDWTDIWRAELSALFQNRFDNIRSQSTSLSLVDTYKLERQVSSLCFDTRKHLSELKVQYNGIDINSDAGVGMLTKAMGCNQNLSANEKLQYIQDSIDTTYLEPATNVTASELAASRAEFDNQQFFSRLSKAILYYEYAKQQLAIEYDVFKYVKPVLEYGSRPFSDGKQADFFVYYRWRNITDYAGSDLRLFQYNIPMLFKEEGTTQCITDITTNKDICNQGSWLLFSDLITNQYVDAYAVTPQESVQRIRDSAEVQRLVGVNVAAQFLAGSIGGDAFVNYLSGKEKLFHTILREPVTLALPGQIDQSECLTSKNKCDPPALRFGWLIGPIYNITEDRDDAEFFQVATNKTVAAELSLPSWWLTLDMKAKVSWVDKGELSQYSLEDQQLSSSSQPLFLPAQEPDFETMFRATPRTVLTSNLSKDKYVDIYGGDPKNVILTGKDIWRVDAVSIGNSISKDVDIIGDMNAISVRMPRLHKHDCIKDTDPGDLDATPPVEPSERCIATIRLWARNAKPIEYGKASLHFDKEPPALPDPVINAAIPNLISVKGDEKENIAITIEGENLMKNEGETPLLFFGKNKLVETSIQFRTIPKESLLISVDPKSLWMPKCGLFKDAPAKTTCDVNLIYQRSDNASAFTTIRINKI